MNYPVHITAISRAKCTGHPVRQTAKNIPIEKIFYAWLNPTATFLGAEVKAYLFFL